MPMRILRGLVFGLLLVSSSCTSPAVPPQTSEAQALAGQVLDLDGKPAPNVLVKGYLISNNSGSLVSNNAMGYRVQASQMETRTDERGRFRLVADGEAINVEAILSDEIKAIQFNASATRALSLQLAYTGSVAGKVTAPDAPTVSDFLGVDVYVPGTSYLAKTDSSGRYTLSNVAVGTFPLVASKAGLGSANLSGVTVTSRSTSAAPDLALSLHAPRITQAVPANAAPGATVTLTGSNFGASTGDPLQVSFNGTPATSVQRVDNQTLRAVVPAGATNGSLVIMVGGILSNAHPFTVLKTLTLNPGNARLKVGETIPCYVLATDTAGEIVSRPAVTWEVQGNGGDLASETFRATAVGTSTLRIVSGTVASTRTFQVIERHPQVTTLAGSTSGFAEGTGSAAQFSTPLDVALDPNGDLLVADTWNYRIRRLTPEGVATTYAGSGVDGTADGPLGSAQFKSPSRLALHPNGDLFVLELHDVVRRIAAGTVTTHAGTGTPGYEDGPPGAAQFSGPAGLVVDPQGNLFVSDTGNNCIRRIAKDGTVTTVAGTLNPGFMDGYGATARFNGPQGLALDAGGNLYIADMGNHAIRKLTPQGLVVTVAGNGSYGFFDGNAREAQFNTPLDVEVGADGRIYVADFMNHRIRVISPGGAVSTLAGRGVKGSKNGEAPLAQFYFPCGMAVAPDGSVYVTESGNHLVRKIQP